MMSKFLILVGVVWIITEKDSTLGLLFLSMGLIFWSTDKR